MPTYFTETWMAFPVDLVVSSEALSLQLPYIWKLFQLF
jgi:hypothetical protein